MEWSGENGERLEHGVEALQHALEKFTAAYSVTGLEEGLRTKSPELFKIIQTLNIERALVSLRIAEEVVSPIECYIAALPQAQQLNAALEIMCGMVLEHVRFISEHARGSNRN